MGSRDHHHQDGSEVREREMSEGCGGCYINAWRYTAEDQKAVKEGLEQGALLSAVEFCKYLDHQKVFCKYFSIAGRYACGRVPPMMQNHEPSLYSI